MTRERALKIREVLQKALQKLDDADALEIVEMYDQWKPFVKYELTQKVREGNKLYKVMQAHDSIDGLEPHNAPALFQEIKDLLPIQEWDENVIYQKDTYVIYEGTVRVSILNNNSYRPDNPIGWVTVV